MAKPKKIPEPRPVKYRCVEHGLFTVMQSYGGGMGQAPSRSRCPVCNKRSLRIRRYGLMHVSVSRDCYDRIVEGAKQRGLTMAGLVKEAVKDLL